MPARSLLSLVILLVAAATAMCSRDPNVVKMRAFEAGNAYVEAGKDREAILECRRAVRADGTFGEARLRLATVYERTGDLQNAFREYIRAAVELDPGATAAWIALANFFGAQERFAEAEASLVTAPALGPTDFVAARSLAILYMPINRMAEAEPILKTLAEAAKTPAAGLMLADFYTATARRSDAMARQLDQVRATATHQ